jgi:ECF sigma factor
LPRENHKDKSRKDLRTEPKSMREVELALGTGYAQNAAWSWASPSHVGPADKNRRIVEVHRKLRLVDAGVAVPANSISDLTGILSAAEQGDPHAADELLQLVYTELRRLAAQKLANETPGQTLDATALVHKAYLRLVPGGDR